MPVPDKSEFARAFLGPRLALVGSMEDTRANTFAAVKAGCIELRKTDSRFGLLAKTSGDNVDGFAADIWLYDLGNGTAQVIDVVSNGEGAPDPGSDIRKPPSPGWGLKDIRPMSQWRAPEGETPVPGPTPTPTPAPQGQRPDTAAAIRALLNVVSQLAAIPPDRPEPPPPPPPPAPEIIEVERPHPSYDDMMDMIHLAQAAYGRHILPPETAAHFVYGYLLEDRTIADILDDARNRGKA